MIRKACTLGTAVLLAALFALPFHGARADTVSSLSAPEWRKSLGGKIAAIDVSGNTITIGDRIFWMPRDIDIRLDGKDATLADLSSGMRVYALLDDDGVIHRIYAHSGLAVGSQGKAVGSQGNVVAKVRAVNPARHELTVFTPEGGTQVVFVGKNPLIDLNGRGAALAQIKPGMTIVINQESPGVIFVKSPRYYARAHTGRLYARR